MKTQTANLFKPVKQLINKAVMAEEDRAKILQALMTVEWSYFCLNTLAQELLRTWARVVGLCKKQKHELPANFLCAMTNFDDMLKEHTEECKKPLPPAKWD